jgi:hypothetical protein
VTNPGIGYIYTFYPKKNSNLPSLLESNKNTFYPKKIQTYPQSLKQQKTQKGAREVRGIIASKQIDRMEMSFTKSFLSCVYNLYKHLSVSERCVVCLSPAPFLFLLFQSMGRRRNGCFLKGRPLETN